MTDLIADLPRDEQPRERMMIHGIETLSNTELIALLLGSGVPGKNALQLARELLREGVANLKKRDVKDLMKTPGIGVGKATRIAAMGELCRRSWSTEEQTPEPPDYDVDTVGRSLIRSLSRYQQEHLGAVFLDSRLRVLRQKEIYVGTIDNALVSTRDIIRLTFEDHSTGIVLYHNHPSGDPRPSVEDLAFSKKIKSSLELCSITLVDHLIIGENRYYSMRQRGWER